MSLVFCFVLVLFFFVIAHFVADYTLQSEWMATHKSPNNRFPWGYVMMGHVLTHSALVAIVADRLTHSITCVFWLALMEGIMHFLIDNSKARKLLDVHSDQILHLACKVIWTCVILKERNII